MDLEDLNLPSDVIDRILSGTTSGDDADAEVHASQLEKMREIASNYRATFANPAGRFVLEHLRSLTIEQSTFVPGVSFRGADGLSAEQNGFMREGQNSIVREIERYVAWEDPEA